MNISDDGPGPLMIDGRESSPGSAISKAFRLLDIIVDSALPISLNDISAMSGLPKPSAFRMLMQLEEVGAIKRDQTGKRFMAGDALNALAVRTLAAATRAPAIREIMTRLVSRIGESCNLGILDGRDVLYLERIECDRPLRMHLRAGSRVPAHCTAMGKLLLAHMPESKARRFLEASELTAFTPNTVTDIDTLVAQFRDIRTSGASINREEFQLGLTGVAVPILIEGQGAVAGLAAHAPVFRMTADEAFERALEPLREAAAAIAAEWVSGSEAERP